MDASFAGRVYPPTRPYLVGREKIREFGAAVGELSPLSHDVRAARAAGYADLVAPPTFAIVVTMPASDVITKDPALGMDFSRVVHGDQRFIYVRPIVAGDELTVVMTVESVRAVAGNDLLGLRAEVLDAAGKTVLAALSSLVARGTAGA
jgi:acyl dehydratase